MKKSVFGGMAVMALAALLALLTLLSARPGFASPTTSVTGAGSAISGMPGMPSGQVQPPGPSFAASPSSPACGPDWVVVPSPNPGANDNSLSAVSAISSNDAWAVGFYIDATNTRRTLTMHWDGSVWSVVPSPTPGVVYNVLYGVSAISSDDVWAVGRYVDDTNTSRTLTMHWDGSAWSVVPSPNIGTRENILREVSAKSSSDVWAVGDYWEAMGGRYRTLTMHWDGSAWSVIPSPNVNNESNVLNAVSAVSANDVWAVGYYDSGNFVYRTLVMRWNGSAWSVVPSLNVGTRSSVLRGVSGVSATDMWAVGYYESGSVIRTLTMHWNGNEWSVVPSPNQGTSSNGLGAVSAVSANDVWAVGGYSLYREQTLVMHWDGNQWSVVPNPNPGVDNYLNAISALSPNDVWAVGYHADGVGQQQTLVERYNPCPPTSTPTSTPPSGTPTRTPSPTPVDFSDVPPTNPFYEAIRCLVGRGIISGYDDGTFRPGNEVTRGQLAKIVSNSAGYSENPHPQIFQDVPPTNPFYEWINRLARRGHMGGYECGGPGEPCVGGMPYFRPFANATRGQTSKIVANAAELSDPVSGQTFEDVPPTHAFYEWIERLARYGVMGGYECGGPGEPCQPGNRAYFRPYNNVTRGQSAKIVANTFYPNCEPR